MRIIILIIAGVFLAAVITGQWLGLAIIAYVAGIATGGFIVSERNGMRRTRR